MNGERRSGAGTRSWGRVYLIGIGGAGMSAIARLLVGAGACVAGSDSVEGAEVERLRSEGIDVFVGHDPAHVRGVDTVIVSSAIRESNPELAWAREHGLPVLHRSEALAALMAGYRSIAVAGTHGKTTTSGMIATALMALARDDPRLDPSIAVGGVLHAELGGAVVISGARSGRGEVFVAEADESDGSFLRYRPDVAVVTNVEPDHLDHYGSAEEFLAAFESFIDCVRPGGTAIIGVDDDGGAALGSWVRMHRPEVHLLTYGRSASADIRVLTQDGDEWSHAGHPGDVSNADIDNVSQHVAVDAAAAGGPDRLRFSLAVPGEHNVLNSVAAVAATVAVGATWADAARAVGVFRGAGRRFDLVGTVAGIRVVDDYAHHPTEVRAALATAQSIATGRLVVAFQPHLFSRTRTFAAQFGAALAAADVVVLTDIYAAREDPIPGIDSGLIVQAVRAAAADQRRRVDVRWAHTLAQTAAELVDSAQPGDIVMTIGAGDITTVAQQVVACLRARWAGA